MIYILSVEHFRLSSESVPSSLKSPPGSRTQPSTSASIPFSNATNDKDPDNTKTKQLSLGKKPKAILLCDQCTYRTRIDHLYQRHVDKHSMDRPFQCPDCGLSDYDHTSFVDHLMDHQQTKILSCCFCQYRTNIFGMRLHMAKHRVVEPYDCSLCEFSSNHAGSLKAHMDVHHTKRFSCNFCKKIMTKHLLMKHTEKVHGVNIEDARGAPLVAVKTVRGMIEDHCDLEGLDSGNDMKQFGDAVFPLNLPYLKLPVPKLLLKRLNLGAVVDSVAVTADEPQCSVLDTLEIFQNACQSPEAEACKMMQPVPMIPTADNRALRLSKPYNNDAHDAHSGSILPDPISPVADVRTLPEPLSPESDSGSIPPESMNPDALQKSYQPNSPPETPYANPDADVILPEFTTPNAGLPDSDSGTNMVPLEPISPDATTRVVLPESMSPDADTGTIVPEPIIPDADTGMIRPEPVSLDADTGMIMSDPVSPNANTGTNMPEPVTPDADTDMILPEPKSPDSDTRTIMSEPMSPDVDTDTILPDPMSPDADTAMTFPEPMSPDADTDVVLPEPLSPDAGAFEPESMIEFEEEIDVKPDLDALVKIVSSKTKMLKTKYRCNDCGFATTKKSFLRQHAPKHLLDRNFICSDCEFKEPNPYIFAKHLASRRAPGAKLIYCSYCDHTNKDVRSMCGHLEKHKPVKLDDCPKCGTVFPSKHNLREHYRVMHDQKYECRECGKWMSKYSLKKHRLTHTAEKAKLRLSSKQGAAKRYEIQNLVTAVPSKPMYRCDSCNYHTRMKSLLRRHVVKHLLPGAELLCSLCNFTDTSAKNFADHLRCHSSEGSYDCCFCEYSTVGLSNLTCHLEIHRCVHFYDCAKCDKSYRQRPALSSHRRAFHVNKHQCPECGEIMTLSKLQLHKKAHEVQNTSGGGSSIVPRMYAYSNEVGDTPQTLYKCEFCKYCTDIESLYTIHTAKHSMDEAYFACPICQYRDQDAYKFSGHLQSHFNDTLTCCFCEYTTTKQSYLSAHLETHRSVHFYDCPKCDKSYKNRKAVWHHHRSYHVDEHTCMDCGEVITYHELLEHKKVHGTSVNESFDMNGHDQEVFYDPSLFNCYHCAYTTKNKSLLRRHAVKHLLDARLVCPDCDFKENHAREFAKHCVSCQGGFNCSVCTFTTSDLSNLAGHVETHRPVLLYDCTECPHSCNSLHNLKNHFKNMHVAEHKCTQCDEVLSRIELKQHQLKHKIPSLNIRADPDAPSVLSVSVCEPGSLLCGYCDYSTDIQSLLDQHVAKHESDSDLVCPECEFSCTSTADFVRHLKNHQLEKDVYVCCFCSFTTFYRGSFPDHIDNHRSIRFYDCPKCDTECSNKSNLKAHYEKFHVVEHLCPSCDTVVTYHKLLMHEEMHAQQENPTYYCDRCHYKTKKKSLIRMHVAKHLDSFFVCPKCQGRELNSDMFVLHLESCLQRGTACCFCGYATTEASCLSQHLEIHRFVPVGFFDCSKCEKSFGRSSKLTEHVRQYHKDKHRCSICGKIMTYSRLFAHMKLHKKSGLSIVSSQLSNRFRCNHCVFTTKKKSLLRRHAPKHLVDNRLACTICKFKTNFPYDFVKHLQAHSNDETMTCCFCDYSTVSKHNLASHVDHHRPVYLNDCWKCDKSYTGYHTLQQHLYKMHVQKHTCYKDKCYLRMPLYRLQKHQSQKHKAAAKEIPYYVCRGPVKKKEEKLAVASKIEAVPMASTSSVMIEVQPDMDLY